MPDYTPFVVLVILIYGTGELLARKPLRLLIKRVYFRYGITHRMLSYVIVFVFGGLLLCFYWWGINKVFDNRHKEPTVTTTKNVESRIKEWLDSLALTGVVVEPAENPKTYFAYSVTFDNQIAIGVSRVRDTASHVDDYVVGQTRIILSDKDEELLDKQSKEEQQSYARALLIEAGRSKMDIQLQAPYHEIYIRKMMRIEGLTEEKFNSELLELRMQDNVILAIVAELINDLKRQTPTPTPPSPTPDTGASPP